MMERPEVLGALALDYRHERVGRGLAIHADCLEWLVRIPEASLHGVVTDPPYGVKEFDADQMEKRRNGRGGIWRIPPSFDGSVRSPLPRFTALNAREREVLREFFVEWSRALVPALRPGAHVFVAGNPFLSQMVFGLNKGGWFVLLQTVAHYRLWRSEKLPKNPYDFLKWGEKKHIFRPVGGGVRFRHNLIQQHLANTSEGVA